MNIRPSVRLKLSSRPSASEALVHLSLCAGLLGCLGSAHAQGLNQPDKLPQPTATQDDSGKVENSSMHAQMTVVDQYHPSFRSRFSGFNSLSAGASQRETADVTAFLGARLWTGAEAYVNPEIDQGFGLSNTVGVAGYPSGEAYKVGKSDPYLRWNRLFVRQTIALGSASEHVDGAANVLAGDKPTDSVVVTAGKFSVPDVFDSNAYAHDARGDFLNWSLIDAGAFDYAADAWGFTGGLSVEINTADWSARFGVFALSDVPNSQKLDSTFRQYSLVTEWEHRASLDGHPGKISILGFLNRGRMGSYNDSLAETNGLSTPDTARVRRYGSRGGLGLNVEQEVRPGLGVFARLSANDGSKEAYEFTEINRSISAGISAKGRPWGRPDDTFAVAMARNSLSLPARRYFAAGGIGILIGDGALPEYGTEQIFESYYGARLSKSATLTGDFQRVVNPAYNRQRGPVSIFAVRLHWAV